MPIVLDTSVLAAFVNPADPLNGSATAIVREAMAGRHGVPVTMDLVVAEGLTLLRRRPGREDVSRRFLSLFEVGSTARGPFRVRHATGDEIQDAFRTHFAHYDRGLSVVDCTLLRLALELNAPIASFDAGFDGLVERVKE